MGVNDLGDAAHVVAQEISSAGGTAFASLGRVSEPESAARIVNGAVERFGRNFPLLTQVWVEPQTAEISINDFGASTAACVYFSGH